MSKFDNSNILSSNNFARQSNVVFSEVISKEEFKKLNVKSLKIVYKDENSVCYINTKLSIKENDIIFSNTDFIEYLFKKLRNIENLKNLKLITQWSDMTIGEQAFSLKPNSISNWYGVHIDYEHNNLKPIPLGLSGEYSNKNLTPKYFQKNEYENHDKKNLLYINFQKNTNDTERSKITDIFENLEWVKIDQPNLQLDKYLNEIKSSYFVLCPFGNGIDTHRLWETLYAGSIPIIKKHVSYETTNDLPVLQVDSFEEITKDYLNEVLKKMNKREFNYEKLNSKFWMNIISSYKIESRENQYIELSLIYFYRIKISYNIERFRNRLKKKFIFRKNQILKKTKVIS